AINLNDEDRLVIARLTDGKNDVIIGTRKGLACRFRESQVRPVGRTAIGVRGIDLDKEDMVVSMVIIRRPDSQIIIVGEKGLGKRTKYEDFRLTKRGAKGVKSMNITEKTGNVIQMLSAIDIEDLMVLTTKGIMIRQSVKTIPTIGRVTQGVRLIRLDEGDTIADLTTVPREEIIEGVEDDNDTNGDENGSNFEGLQESLL
ncbi:MAG: DNA gyrase C-terminal beta-propeller domain-containing protein, partial [Bacteroidota bacterium]